MILVDLVSNFAFFSYFAFIFGWLLLRLALIAGILVELLVELLHGGVLNHQLLVVIHQLQVFFLVVYLFGEFFQLYGLLRNNPGRSLSGWYKVTPARGY